MGIGAKRLTTQSRTSRSHGGQASFFGQPNACAEHQAIEPSRRRSQPADSSSAWPRPPPIAQACTRPARSVCRLKRGARQRPAATAKRIAIVNVQAPWRGVTARIGLAEKERGKEPGSAGPGRTMYNVLCLGSAQNHPLSRWCTVVTLV